jgi:hypothetical protein
MPERGGILKERSEMNFMSRSGARLILACSMVVFVSIMPGVIPLAQEKSKEKPPQLSEGERDALRKIQNAKDIQAKLQASAEFLKKYPRSMQRTNVAMYVAGEIARLQDPAQVINFSESFLNTFKEPGDAAIINPILIEAYIKASKFDEAFQRATDYLEKNPENVPILVEMARLSTQQAQAGNSKFVAQGQKFGAKAIELIEADKKPENLDADRWSEYKTKWLPQLYQWTGFLSFVNNDIAGAKSKLEKAASLSPSEPVVYYLIGFVLNSEYQQLAQQYKSTSPGPMQDEILKQAHAKLDQVIDAYAHAVALAWGKPQYQQLQDALMQDLQSYYKYRHNGSIEGLQQLIDKYKK